MVRPGVPGSQADGPVRPHPVPATAALAVRLAELPDDVRGHEDVKTRAVESYHRSLAELRTQLDEVPAGPA